MRTTRYFAEQIARKRPYLQSDWIIRVLESPARIEVQPDGRIRHWGYTAEVGRHLRVVTLEDGVMVHNAFFDRRFRDGAP